MIGRMVTRIKRADSPVFAALKRAAKALLSLHLPVVRYVTRPVFAVLYGLHVCLRETLILLVKFFWYEPLFRSQCRSVGSNFHMEKLPYLNGTGNIVIGNNVRLSGKPQISFNNRLGEDAEFIIGDNTFIGHGCSFAVAGSVRIGSYCLLAGGVTVADNDGHPLDADRRRRGEPVSPEQVKPVVIGDDVWLGRDVMVLKGVTIGRGAVVGAHALVTRDVPANTVVAGNPAKAVKELREG